MRRFLALLVLGVLTGSQAAAFKCGMDGKTTGRIAYADGPRHDPGGGDSKAGGGHPPMHHDGDRGGEECLMPMACGWLSSQPAQDTRVRQFTGAPLRPHRISLPLSSVSPRDIVSPPPRCV